MKIIEPCKRLIPVFLLFSAFPSLGASELFDAMIYETGSGELLFLYSNRVEAVVGGRTLTHEYRWTNGELFARERVVMTPDGFIRHSTDFYKLGEFSLLTRQGSDIDISFTRGGKTREKAIAYPDDPGEELVFGPTQQEFIRRNLQRFIAGETVSFLVPAPEFSTLVRFTMAPLPESEYAREGALVIVMETKSPFLRFLVGTNFFVIDEGDGRILEIHGPSVLKKWNGGKWKFVDVDILFTYR